MERVLPYPYVNFCQCSNDKITPSARTHGFGKNPVTTTPPGGRKKNPLNSVFLSLLGIGQQKQHGRLKRE